MVFFLRNATVATVARKFHLEVLTEMCTSDGSGYFMLLSVKKKILVSNVFGNMYFLLQSE